MCVMKKAVLYRKLPNGIVQCTACSWYCRIKPGRVGTCCTRLNKNGDLYSLVYGKTTGVALDPVEKKPLFHFLPGGNLLSFGTAGCNFGCLFCQNAWTSQGNKTIAGNPSAFAESSIRSLSIDMSPEAIVAAALREHADGIAYTYNEPAVFAEYAGDTARIARKHGLKNVFVSNGYESDEAFGYLKNVLDAINIDLKAFTDDFYKQICQASIAPVKNNIRRFFEAGIETEVTTLIIPGRNDSETELAGIAEFLADISPDIPWHISAFHPDYRLTDAPATPLSTLIRAYGIGKNAGMNFIYAGNVNTDEYAATSCPACGKRLISRYNYSTVVHEDVFDPDHGQCRSCGKKIYGTWH